MGIQINKINNCRNCSSCHVAKWRFMRLKGYCGVMNGLRSMNIYPLLIPIDRIYKFGATSVLFAIV